VVTTEVESIADLAAFVGTHLGYSDYHVVTQDAVDQFADATGDHQWIHVDPVRAAQGPFGATIAHGYFTLALAPVLLGSLLQVKGVTMGVNYGTNKVRFPAPVLVGAAVRAGATLVSFDEFDGGAQIVLDVTLEVRDAVKPSCVAQLVARYYH